MSILIGCSPSTGSSLLRRLLNRHSALFCGSETSLFAKTELYDEWKANKSKILRPSLFGVPNAGWHSIMGIQLDEDYGYDRKRLRTLISNSNQDFPSFITSFYEPILANTGKRIWIEKTPSNAFTFAQFLASFPEGNVIHIVRHPLDAITSLINRGMTIYNAVAVYLLNTAQALEHKDNPRYFQLSYENLVQTPELVLTELCAFIGVEYEPAMLTKKDAETGVSKMRGWQYDETDQVRQGSLGRYNALSEPLQQELLARLAITYSNLDTSYTSISELAAYLGYDLPPLQSTFQILDKLKIERADDIKKRSFSRAYFKNSNYPIAFRDELV